MLSALLYLRFTSLKNWLRQRLLRLKQPKYFIGAIVGGLYFWFFFFRRTVGGPGTGARRQAMQQASQAFQSAGVALPPDAGSVALAIGALALLVMVTLAWVLSQERASLGFSEAEIAFLFPAPVTRQTLVHFRLVDAQLRSLIGAAFMTLFSNRWTFVPGNTATHAFGWWLIFSAFNLHLAGVRFTLTRLADLGLGTLRRRALVLALLAAVLAATWVLLPEATKTPHFGERDGAGALARWLAEVLGGAPLAWVLWPAKLLLGPFFAENLRSFLLALGPALFVLGVHYVWAVRSVVSFEEGSIARAEKRAATIAAMRSGRRMSTPVKGRKEPFALAGTGRPEFAFLWKNLLSTWSWLNVRVWLGCALTIVVAGLWAQSHAEWRAVLTPLGVMPLVFGGYLLLVGPQFARQDIRQDLGNADILKTYPLPGWQIVLGELLTPVAILTGFIWLLLLAAGVMFHPDPAKLGAGLQELLSPGTRLMFALGLAIVAPPFIALQLFVPNAAALYFPAWFQATRQRGGGGIDIMGQRLIFFAAQFLTMLLMLLPAALLAVALVFVVSLFKLPLAVGLWLATAAVLAVLLGELWLGLHLLGKRFEKFDLSAELRP